MLLKCKICGGTLDIEKGTTVATCEYCGTKQTLPRIDDDRRANMYDRANQFRRNNEYDKAMAIFEQILNEDITDSEAYWGIVLCRYGIEYVEDPVKHKRIPTVNRVQYTSVVSDDDYKKAIENADAEQKEVYGSEARSIDEIQKGILEISQKEEPFDLFLCYKETDENGRRTEDSVIANDIYQQLTAEGYKVFFSRITLEDKLGTAYEPYIFAALNSAKAMIVIGTKPEYFNAPWVKNEWGRYLALIKKGEKKTLIPAYKYMFADELPPEFAYLQAQDMGKLGFMQDLIRGLKKVVGDKVAEREEREKELASSKAKRKKRKIAIVLAAIVLIPSIIGGAYYLKQNNQYKIAQNYMKNGQYYEAYNTFSSLNGFRDSEDMAISARLSQAGGLIQSQELFDALDILYSLGDNHSAVNYISYIDESYFVPSGRFILGSYNGEPIWWIILCREDDRILAMTVNDITTMRYDDDSSIYEGSEIRAWLNDDFYVDTFAEEADRVIVDVTTGDNVFLLSNEQMNQYGYTVSGTTWLRSENSESSQMANYFAFGGGINRTMVDCADIGVHPCVWLSLDS